MMTATDLETATIKKALLFYQQHLVVERQRLESQYPRNGKLRATSEDGSSEDAYDSQLRTIATILESRQMNPEPTLLDFTESKPALAPVQQGADLDDSANAPIINLF